LFRDVFWKLRYVFLPLALLALFVPPFYSAAIWLLEQTGLDLDSERVGLWLPGMLAFGLVEYFIQSHLSKLKFPNKGNLEGLYFLVAFIALAVPIGMAHWAAESEFATVARIVSSADISPSDRTSYYIIQKTCMEREKARAYSTVRRDARYNTPEDFEIYVTVPECSQPNPPKVWIGLFYSGEIKDRLSNSAMENEYRAFAAKTEQNFAKEDTSTFRYLERLGASRQRRNFLRAIEGKSGPVGPVTIVVPYKEAFVRLTSTAVRAYVWSLGIGLTLWLVMILLIGLDHEKLHPLNKRDEELKSQLLSRFYRPRRNHYGPAVLIDINIAIFAAMALSGLGFVSFETDDLIAWGATSGALDHGWGLYRLVSSLFVHDGLMHLLGNMYGLFFACFYLTSVGKSIAKNSRLIFAYLFCGVIGNVAGLVVHPQMIAVGASGAIMGLWGVLAVLALLRDERLEGNEKGVLTNVGIFAGLTILFGFLLPGIDNVAHVGGFATGMALGLVFYVIDRNRGATKSAEPAPLAEG
jgi:rhomboid protease GluP